MTAETTAVEVQGTLAQAAGPRMFHLERDTDVSGVSGIGRVADGVLWPDGSATIRWRGDQPSTVNWATIKHAEAVHGHGGQTRIVFDDDLADQKPVDTPRPVDEAKPKRRPVLVGTGMPATTLLEAFGQWIHDAFGATAYHVGSSIHGKTWRDVDVRLILDDDQFYALFPGYRYAHQIDARWALVCAAISELGKALTGLPVDFQIQRTTEANKRYPGPRNPLYYFTHASVEAEEERRAQARAQAETEGHAAADPR